MSYFINSIFDTLKSFWLTLKYYGSSGNCMELFYGLSEINHLAIYLRYSIYLGWNIMSPKWINFCLLIPGETKANFLVGQLVRTDYIHCSISGLCLVTTYLDNLHLFLLYKVSLLSICMLIWNHSIYYYNFY